MNIQVKKLAQPTYLQNKQIMGAKKQNSFKGKDVKMEGNEQLALMNKAAIDSPLEKVKTGIKLYSEYIAATPDVTSGADKTTDVKKLALALIDPEVRKNFSEKKADPKLQNLLKQTQDPKVASAVLNTLEKALGKALQIAEDEAEAKAILQKKDEIKSFNQLIKTAASEQGISFKGGKGFITERGDRNISKGELALDTIQQLPPHLRKQVLKACVQAIKSHDMTKLRQLLPDCKLTEEIQNQICSFVGVNIDDESSRGKILGVLNKLLPDHDDHINHDAIDSRHVLLNARHAEIDAGDTIEHAEGLDVDDHFDIPVGTAIASGLRIANHLSKGEKKKACIEAGVTTAKVAATPVTVPAKVTVASTTAVGGGLVGAGIGAGIGTLLCPGAGTAAGAAIGKGIGLATGGIAGFIASQKAENKVWEKTKKFLNDECVIM